MGERRGAVGGLGCSLHEALDREVALFDAARDEIETAGNNAQHIVEVVRDAAGELADGFHLMHLPQMLFGRLAQIDLLDKLAIGRHELVARGGQRDKGLPRCDADEHPDHADQKKGGAGADLQKHAEGQRTRLAQRQQPVLFARHHID